MSRTAFVLALTLVLVAILLILSNPVRADGTSQASTIIRPNGDFVVNLWSDPANGCATDSTRFTALTEGVQDGNTTCRATVPTTDNWQLSFEDVTSPAGTINIDVLVSVTARTEGGETLRVSFFGPLPCGIESEQPISDFNLSGPYLTKTALLERCASTNNPGDPDWTDERVNAMRADLDCVPTGSGRCFVTQAWAEVRFTIQSPGVGPPLPPPPPVTIPNQIATAAVSTFRDFCSLWLLLFLIVIVAVAFIVRHAKRHGDLPQ